jgi:hypothetical protein
LRNFVRFEHQILDHRASGDYALQVGAAYWIKSKNPNAPALKREAEENWGKWRFLGAEKIRQPALKGIRAQPRVGISLPRPASCRWGATGYLLGKK